METVRERRGAVRRPMLVAALLLGALPLAAASRSVELPGGDRASLTRQREIHLEALPRSGEGLFAFAERLCGSPDAAAAISEANHGTRRLLRGVRYRVPFDELSPDRQQAVLRALFPDDELLAGGWRHRIGAADVDGYESLWSVAHWFTGRGESFREIREANRLEDTDVEPGQSVLVPARLLRPALRHALPEPSQHQLTYGADAAGEYALYRLRRGEALYSSVVIRFTGRVFAEDVNVLAEEVAERSGIGDVTDIPVGYGVKVPFELLMPEFLPAGHPRRSEYETELAASARYSNPVHAASLRGVTVILDSGHGGSDVGASPNGVWESIYVYDIMMRTRDLLEKVTAARVETLTMDGASYRIVDRDVLPTSRAHRVLTTPDYPIGNSTVALNLRWYLANSIFRRAVRQGDRDKVVFISIHADSLHPSLRGAMAYVPGARYRLDSYGKTGTVYASRQEVREQPRVSFSQTDRVRSEGLSRDLAASVIRAFEAKRLAVHPDKPIRDKVVRRSSAWVPAILRYNEVPAQLLLEVCNLANERDRELIQSRAFRQQVAEALVAGIVDYYGHPQPDTAATIAGR